MRNGSFEVQMFIDGRTVREFEAAGRNCLLAKGERDFVLRVKNNTGGRVEVVASVDGLSVMDGKLASSRDRGYVVNAYDSFDIPGYRLNDHEVATFRLGAIQASYARQMDAKTDVGVIGVRIFSEHVPQPVYRGGGYKGFMPGSLSRGGSMESFGGGSDLLGGSEKGLGTGFGDRAEHRVTRTSFDRDRLVAEFALEYNNEAGFRAAGIQVPPEPTPRKDPFPGDSIGATPPKGWRG